VTPAAAKPPWWDGAVRDLTRGDRTLARIIRRHPGLHLARRGEPFTTLARAIVGQQISVRAAQSIWERVVAATTGAGATPATAPAVAAGATAGGVPTDAAVRLDPARVARTRLPTLARCGLSARKAEYIRDLARHFASGRLEPSTWPALDDEALIGQLVDVKGIGRWTAEMFLIFHELRADVFPVDDIGLQKAVALHYHGGERMTPATLHAFGERWRPWRSAATWYLWRSLDPIPVEY
jgi:DNA-3-methyladenine glycosylase II